MEFKSRVAVYEECSNPGMLSSEKIKEFNLNWFNQNKTQGKFIQVYIDKEPYIRMGCRVNHSLLLELLLTEFNIKYETRESKLDAYEIPLEKGDNYQLIGAGRIIKINDDVVFNDFSMDYSLAPNLEHLLKIKKFTKLSIFDAKSYKKEKPISAWYNIAPNL